MTLVNHYFTQCWWPRLFQSLHGLHMSMQVCMLFTYTLNSVSVFDLLLNILLWVILLFAEGTPYDYISIKIVKFLSSRVMYVIHLFWWRYHFVSYLYNQITMWGSCVCDVTPSFVKVMYQYRCSLLLMLYYSAHRWQHADSYHALIQYRYITELSCFHCTSLNINHGKKTICLMIQPVFIVLHWK